ncbi:MAG: sigma 54-interacting transcriptional regulator [Candidatus Acidiferrales bacterium]
MANTMSGRVTTEDGGGFVGGMSPAIQTLESVISEIAPTNIPVLLVGESGSGKEMFAHQIHRLSRNAKEPLAKIACASMNSATFAAELGLGADSGSNGDRSKIQAGTVVFDEISEMDAACQRSLHYALPDGDTKPRAGLLTARVISTTARNLDEEMRAGRFRNELYYRINGVCLRLPPLRERKEDIPLLVEYFLTKHAGQFARPRPSLSPRTLRVFMDHMWPGNIRELENVVKKIVALGDEQIAVSELAVTPVEVRVEARDTDRFSLKAAARAASREAEREMIMKALARTRWNRKRAAQELQISYKSLLYKLKQIGFEGSETN